MSSLTDMLQPETEGLVIATHDHLAYPNQTRLSLWYYDRPRRFHECTEISCLISFNGTLVANKEVRQGHSWKRQLCDILEEKIISPEVFMHLCTDGNTLYGVKESKEIVDVERDHTFYSYRPLHIGPIMNSELETRITRHCHTLSIAVDIQGNVILGEIAFPFSTILGPPWRDPRCVRIDPQGKESIIYDMSKYKEYFTHCLLVHPKGVLIGTEYGIYNATKDQQVHYFSQAASYGRYLQEWWRDGPEGNRKERIAEMKAWFKEEGIPVPHENRRREMDFFGALGEFIVQHMVLYQSQVVFATHRNIYMEGQERPVWRFRHPIVGLAVVNQDLLRNIEGQTGVRCGRKRSAQFTTTQRLFHRVA